MKIILKYYDEKGNLKIVKGKNKIINFPVSAIKFKVLKNVKE